MSVLQKGK
jgi:hypothetical protein